MKEKLKWKWKLNLKFDFEITAAIRNGVEVEETHLICFCGTSTVHYTTSSLCSYVGSNTLISNTCEWMRRPTTWVFYKEIPFKKKKKIRKKRRKKSDGINNNNYNSNYNYHINKFLKFSKESGKRKEESISKSPSFEMLCGTMAVKLF